MPPPLPNNFLPANRRRQHLDPTRHLKSRELWNQVRFHASSHHSHNSTNNNSQQQQAQQWQQGEQDVLSSSRLQWALALFRAITYELQPFCIKPLLRRIRIFISEEEGLPQLSASLLNSTLSFGVGVWKILHQRLQQTSFQSVQSYLKNNQLLLHSGGYLLLLRCWYHLVVYLHDLLHVGPILVLLTLCILMFTIGLGDNTGAATGIPSAYSVFNRGMQRILGTMDAEELARQYAGGAMIARAGVLNNQNQQHHNLVDGNDIVDNGNFFERNDNEEQQEESEEEEQPLVNEQRRRRRLERLEQRQQIDEALHGGDDENNNNHDNGADQAPNQAPMPNNNEGNAVIAAAAANTTAAVSKKSGKKARRQNLELRREMQRQRQAAAALGFVGDGGDVNNEREREARMALLE